MHIKGFFNSLNMCNCLASSGSIFHLSFVVCNALIVLTSGRHTSIPFSVTVFPTHGNSISEKRPVVPKYSMVSFYASMHSFYASMWVAYLYLVFCTVVLEVIFLFYRLPQPQHSLPVIQLGDFFSGTRLCCPQVLRQTCALGLTRDNWHWCAYHQ